MPLQAIRSTVQSDVDATNDLIIDTLKTSLEKAHQNPLSRKLCDHILKSPGKRIRSLLLLLVARACGFEGTEHLSHAAAIEFFHTATLLHDDVIDDSNLRRGLKTANFLWGSKVSILAGDDLYSKALKMIAKTKHFSVLEIFIDCAHDIIGGEIHQLANKHKVDVDEDYYFSVIKAKTALLFKISAEIGAHISPLADEVSQSLSLFGLHLGNAFQIIDDAIDYCSDSHISGKSKGDDLKDGKMTLPLIYAHQTASKSQRKLIEKSIKAGTIAHFQDILTIMDETKALEKTYQRANEEVDKALSELSALPDSPYKSALSELALFSLKRES